MISLFFISLAYVVLALALTAAVMAPIALFENKNNRAIKRVVAILSASVVAVSLDIAAIAFLTQHLTHSNGCSDNETKLTKRVGKTTVEKCVPDQELGFLFN